MEIITIECASIFNIDFAACLYASVESDHELVLIIKDTADISSSYRRFISRLAFPVMDWEYNDDDKWRLVHLPIEQLHEGVQQAFYAIADNITTLLKKGHYYDFESIYSRASELAILYMDNPLHFYQNVIAEIFEQVVGKRPRILLSSSAFDQQLVIRGKNNFFEALVSFCKLHNGQRIQIVKSGALKISVEGKKQKIKKASIVDGHLLFYIGSVETPIYQVDLSNNDEWNKLITRSELEGQFEVFILNNYGTLGHLSYFYHSTSSRQSSLKEYISPISVADNKRVSLFNKGEGHRLTPGGASLIDFDSAEVLSLIRGICNSSEIEIHDLNDWKHLANNYPRSDEKLQEHQGEIKTYYKLRVDAAQKDYRHGRLMRNTMIFVTPKALLFTLYGEYLIEYHAWLRHLRNVISMDNDIHLTPQEITYLTQIGHVNLGYYDVWPVLTSLRTIFIITGEELCRSGFSKIKWIDLKERFESLHRRIYRTRFFPIKKAGLQQFKDFNHIGQLAPVIELMLEYYYSFVSFTLASTLKANIFNCYLIFGANGYKKMIKNILAQRKSQRVLHYDLCHFKF